MYQQRWGVLLAFALSSAMNAFLWICFSPISVLVTSTDVGGFGISALQVNMLSLVFMVFYFPGAFISLYVTERYGLRAALILAATLDTVGAFIRYFGTFAGTHAGVYATVMVGQCIAALAQPIFINAPARIAGDWFAQEQRGVATTIAAMANPIGNALGSSLPSLASGPGDIPDLLLYQGIVCVAIQAITMLVVTRDRPLTPPSTASVVRAASRKFADPKSGLQPHDADSAAVRSSGTGEVLSTASGATMTPSWRVSLARMTHDMRSILKNANFLFLTAGFGVGLGIFNAVMTVIAQLLQPCGYGDDIAGAAGGALLAGGLIGAGIAGYLLDRTRAFAPLLRIGMVATVAATIFMLSSLRKDADVEVVASFALLGFFLIPLLPLSLENAAECTFPVPEDTSATLLLGLGQITGIALIFALTALLSMDVVQSCDTVATASAGLLLGFMLAAALCIGAYRKDYRRLHHEQAASGAQQATAGEDPNPPTVASGAKAILNLDGAGTQVTGNFAQGQESYQHDHDP